MYVPALAYSVRSAYALPPSSGVKRQVPISPSIQMALFYLPRANRLPVIQAGIGCVGFACAKGILNNAGRVVAHAQLKTAPSAPPGCAESFSYHSAAACQPSSSRKGIVRPKVHRHGLSAAGNTAKVPSAPSFWPEPPSGKAIVPVRFFRHIPALSSSCG